MELKWRHHKVPGEQAKTLARALGVSNIAASLLIRLGYRDPVEAERFLNPRLRDLECPFRLRNLDKAIERLRLALANKEEILIFGDYDVDGVTSTTLLAALLTEYGATPRFLVPRRMEEGYGLSLKALERALSDDEPRPDLLVALDCGTNSRDEVAYLREQGIDVLIIDHHQFKTATLPDCILVNPHVSNPDLPAGCEPEAVLEEALDDAELNGGGQPNGSANVPWRDLCTVGLVFKVAHGLVKQLREEGDERALKTDLKDYLDLVALGTVADLVPLVGENRILAKAGLRSLQRPTRPGLFALCEASRINLEGEISTTDISFKLAPRVNASGRLADASLPINLFLSNDWTFCQESARQLDVFNDERREIEREIFAQAEEKVQDSLGDASGFVLYDSSWHPGVVGIVASRIVQKYNRPSIVFGAEGAMAKGSGRSIPGINLVEVLGACTELLDHWGGHPMAVGATAEPENMETLQRAFDRGIQRLLQGELPGREVEIHEWVRAKELGPELLNELDRLHPFGQGNPEPTFGMRRIVLARAPEIFGRNKEHFRFHIRTQPGSKILAVAWKQADELPPIGKPIDIAFKLVWNCWKGRKHPQVVVKAWRTA